MVPEQGRIAKVHLCVPYAMGYPCLIRLTACSTPCCRSRRRLYARSYTRGARLRIRTDALDEEVVGPMLGKQFANG